MKGLRAPHMDWGPFNGMPRKIFSRFFVTNRFAVALPNIRHALYGLRGPVCSPATHCVSGGYMGTRRFVIDEAAGVLYLPCQLSLRS